MRLRYHLQISSADAAAVAQHSSVVSFCIFSWSNGAANINCDIQFAQCLSFSLRQRLLTSCDRLCNLRKKLCVFVPRSVKQFFAVFSAGGCKLSFLSYLNLSFSGVQACVSNALRKCLGRSFCWERKSLTVLLSNRRGIKRRSFGGGIGDYYYFIYSFGYLICHAPVADKEVDFAHFKVAQSVLLCLASFFLSGTSARLTLSFFFSLAAAATMWNGLWSRRADGCCLINYRRSLIHLSCSTYYYYYDPLSSCSSSLPQPLFEVALFVSHNWLLSPCFAKSKEDTCNVVHMCAAAAFAASLIKLSTLFWIQYFGAGGGGGPGFPRPIVHFLFSCCCCCLSNNK